MGTVEAVCDTQGGDAIVTAFIPAMKNMVDSSQNNTYIDPTSACNAPLWNTVDSTPGEAAIIAYGSLCYCNGALTV